MTQEEIAYAAGLLEGEGCFSFQREGRWPKIRMETTDHDVALRLQAFLGCGTIRTTKRRQAHHKQAWMFQVARRAEVERVLQAILPWMSERRRERIDTLLASLS